MYSASVAASTPILTYIGLSLLVPGVIIILLSIILFVRGKRSGQATRFAAYMVVGIIIIACGIPIYVIQARTSQNAVINVGNGYLEISGPRIGEHNYSSSSIKDAFLENINTGSLTLAKRTGGISTGSLNEGNFVLSNGNSAYVISDNDTVLVVEPYSGPTLLLGTSNTAALAAAFNSEVSPVSGLNT